MCGVVGFLTPDGCSERRAGAIAREMADAVAHRGPDDVGVWMDAVTTLAHRRLAVVDLSSTGHQPMLSASARYAISFNGEIYNHREIRRRVDQERGRSSWKGTSDTESLLAAVECFGIDGALRHTVGMFAFAVWDRRDRLLYLARDRMGEKPLYYGWQKRTLLFGSELKAITSHPAFQAQVDRDALSLFLRYNYIPTPWSIFKGIYKVPPGTYVTIYAGRDGSSIGELPKPKQYWSLYGAVDSGLIEPFEGSVDDAIETLHATLLDAVAPQTIADVPVGAFLSSGIDSTAIVALMQSQASRAVRTFTIGFRERDRDETIPARKIAQHLGTDHKNLYVSPRDALEIIPQLPVLYDEPFADSSQIPTFLVSRMARQDVTVALSGDGGDELFGGYDRYFRMRTICRLRSVLPGPLRRAIQHTLGFLSGYQRLSIRTIAKFQRFQTILGCESAEGLYYQRLSQWQCPEMVVRGGKEPVTAVSDSHQWPGGSRFESRMMAIDALTYLPDDILVKVDRAAMGVSLETRAPFLDHRVVEFAYSLPQSLKIRGTESKWILRQVLRKYVPDTFVNRSKKGFSVPIGEWLRGPLRDWAESLLNEQLLRQQGFFEAGPIRSNWQEHVAGARDWTGHIWSVLMFQAWLERVRTGRV